MIRRFLHDKIVSLKKTQPEIDTLISIYAHTRPLDHIKPGVILSLGDIIATIADTSRLKVNILPHLHVTFGLPSPELVFENFIWNDMRHPGLVDLLNPQGAIDWPWLALDPQKTKRLCPD